LDEKNDCDEMFWTVGMGYDCWWGLKMNEFGAVLLFLKFLIY
jgi:hypothetical protein